MPAARCGIRTAVAHRADCVPNQTRNHTMKQTHRTAGPMLAVLATLSALTLSACASSDNDAMQPPPAEAAPADAMPAAEPAPADATMGDTTPPADPAMPPEQTETPPPADGTP
jgi:hypothetical protein